MIMQHWRFWQPWCLQFKCSGMYVMSLGVLQHVEGVECLHPQSEAIQGTTILQTIGYSSVTQYHIPEDLNLNLHVCWKGLKIWETLGSKNLSGRVFGTTWYVMLVWYCVMCVSYSCTMVSLWHEGICCTFIWMLSCQWHYLGFHFPYQHASFQAQVILM
jgi:hypothetical protein